MIYQEIKIKDIEPKLKDSEAILRIFLHSPVAEYGCGFSWPSMLVLPGGGYTFGSEREADDVAFSYLAEGFNCFVLKYTCNKIYPQCHLEVAASMKFIHDHKDEFKLYDSNSSLVGFSAGGHLAGSYSYLYKELAEMLSYDPNDIKPSAQVLCYPVISLINNTHIGSAQNITGGDEALLKHLSIEQHVTSEYPPTYIWTTSEDTVVNPSNTKVMVEALQKAAVPHEWFIFKMFEHGASISTRAVTMTRDPLTKEHEELAQWVKKSSRFVYQYNK